MSRLLMSGMFDKPAGYKLKTGATPGSVNPGDYEPVALDSEHCDILSFAPLLAPPAGTTNRNTVRFQADFNGEDAVIMRVAYKADNAAWIVAPLRSFNSSGLTASDAVKLPPGTVALSVMRMDAGHGAIGWTLDLEV